MKLQQYEFRPRNGNIFNQSVNLNESGRQSHVVVRGQPPKLNIAVNRSMIAVKNSVSPYRPQYTGNDSK